MSTMNENDCGCCEGVEAQTPAKIYNPPGLSAISYRVGTYAQFKQSMLAQLSDSTLPGLKQLQTRDDDDFSIALLDCWAVAADVLTFYQERIANESYKATATEPGSLLELAQLVNYKLQPGVAANTDLAFIIESAIGSPDETTIPLGTKVQSLPNPGELPQIFETIEDIEAHKAWSLLKPGTTKKQDLKAGMSPIVLSGTNTNLRPGDTLLIVTGNTIDTTSVMRVRSVAIDSAKQQTTVQLDSLDSASGSDSMTTPATLPAQQTPSAPAAGQAPSSASSAAPGQTSSLAVPGQSPSTTTVVSGTSTGNDNIGTFFKGIPSVLGNWFSQVWTFFKSIPSTIGGWLSHVWPFSLIARSSASSSSPGQVSQASNPQPPVEADKTLGNTAGQTAPSPPAVSQHALEDEALIKGLPISVVSANQVAPPSQPPTNGDTTPTTPAGPGSQTKIVPGAYTLRVHASLFGYNAIDWNALHDDIRKHYPDSGDGDWKLKAQLDAKGELNELELDRAYPQIIPGSLIVVEQPDKTLVVRQVKQTIETAVSNYALSGKVTQLTIDPPTITIGQSTKNGTLFSLYRRVTVYAQSEQLTLADIPDIDLVKGKSVEIPGLLDGPGEGRTMIVTGQTSDPDARQTAELVIVNDSTLSAKGMTLNFKEPGLLNSYQPDSVSIYGNVARATQGETITDEIIGSGDATQPYQSFSLRQSPLTYIQAATTDGKASTLKITVDGIQWSEVDTFYGHGPRERIYTTRIEDDGTVTVTFGDGKTGARLPTGEDNVHAKYRKGIGLQGGVQTGQLSVLLTRPLGVKSVTNPSAPTGADDPETKEDAQRNATNTIFTLGRIVSEQDYEEYVRSYAGVSKAQANSLWVNQAWSVCVTIAGPVAPDTLIGTQIIPGSALYNKILSGIRRASDPTIPFVLQTFSLILFRLAARVKVNPNAASDEVLQAVELAVASTFSFENRSFGQDVTLDEVKDVVAKVPGVVRVEIDTFYQALKESEKNEGIHAELTVPDELPDGTMVSAAELLIAAPHPFDSLEVIP